MVAAYSVVSGINSPLLLVTLWLWDYIGIEGRFDAGEAME